MDAQLRESFLKELMILQSPPSISSADPTSTPTTQSSSSSTSTSTTTTKQAQKATNTTCPRSDQHRHNSVLEAVVPGKHLKTNEPTSSLSQNGQHHQPTVEVVLPFIRQQQQQQQLDTKQTGVGSNANKTSKRPEAQLTDDELKQLGKQTYRPIDITLVNESGSTGRTLSASFVACDTNLTHILLNDLKTPIGIQSSALMRLNDVIAISYR